ncbi:hypothetical protein [Bdellovibrio reynosensis]|uniref:Uncharacterized protein n=1 Tax=Bdellovibrio reynosensis TaxID=2835041 RepID=A0ABY4CAQ1_9BACT|nr:hypothetical protein [Bdellovibrio reynosensis]UOF02047.1 hypothetical protein MNR06_03645 [Bdellovibrio reynosensis]
MRSTLLVALLLALTPVTFAAPAAETPNGDAESFRRETLRRDLMEEQYENRESDRYISRDPSAMPCPSPQTKLDEARTMSQLEPHSTTCPADGAIMKSEAPEAFSPNSTVE